MSIDVEDQVRTALHEIADDARPAPLMQRLEAGRGATRPRLLRHRSVVGAVAAVVVALLVAALMSRAEHARRIDPAERLPKVITLSESGTLSPGRVLLAISLAADSENDNTPSYLLTSNETEAVLLPQTGEVQGHWTQHLSADGASFVRQGWQTQADVEIVDLRAGSVDHAGGARGHCPTLSPDGSLLVAADYATGDVVLIDRVSGTVNQIAAEGPECGYHSFAWAPDSERMVVRGRYGSGLRDLHGRVLRELPGRLANGSMSWSPDGRDLLMYRSATGGFAVVSVADGTATALPAPAGDARPLGWTGDRVVWLVGGVGDQRLVTTDREGRDRQLWTRLALGTRQVDNITWSRALTGRG